MYEAVKGTTKVPVVVIEKWSAINTPGWMMVSWELQWIQGAVGLNENSRAESDKLALRHVSLKNTWKAMINIISVPICWGPLCAKKYASYTLFHLITHPLSLGKADVGSPTFYFWDTWDSEKVWCSCKVTQQVMTQPTFDPLPLSDPFRFTTLCYHNYTFKIGNQKNLTGLPSH